MAHAFLFQPVRIAAGSRCSIKQQPWVVKELGRRHLSCSGAWQKDVAGRDYLRFRPGNEDGLEATDTTLKEAIDSKRYTNNDVDGGLNSSRTGHSYLRHLNNNHIKIIRSREAAKKARKQMFSSTRPHFALVPTMGALHSGHLSLVKAAALENEQVWVSVFLNPTQFGPTEDLATYPQTWDDDLAKLKEMNVHLAKIGAKGRVTGVFAPRLQTMYPGTRPGETNPASRSFVNIDDRLVGILEGAARPTFFRGVATVVMKLFNIVQPDVAYFGQKDIQQLTVLKRMKRDFMLDVKIRAVPTERDENGLALSSRNAYLGERRRKVALVLNRALRAGREAWAAGKTSKDEILGAALDVCRKVREEQRELPPSRRARFEVEYISLANGFDLQEIDDTRDVKNVVLSGTIIMLPLEEAQEGEKLGIEQDLKTVRLLDNLVWRSQPSSSDVEGPEALDDEVEEESWDEEDEKLIDRY